MGFSRWGGRPFPAMTPGSRWQGDLAWAVISNAGDRNIPRPSTGFEHTAYRLETLQRYEDDSETVMLRSFLAGEPQPHDHGKEQWTARITAAVASGRRMQRVHVVVEPVSDYLRFELAWSYGPNVAAGEDIGIVPVSSGQWPPDLATQ